MAKKLWPYFSFIYEVFRLQIVHWASEISVYFKAQKNITLRLGSASYKKPSTNMHVLYSLGTFLFFSVLALQPELT